jgi:hypothetical protein
MMLVSGLGFLAIYSASALQATDTPASPPAQAVVSEKLRCEVINVGTFFADPKFRRVCGTKADWTRYRQLEQKRSRQAISQARYF